MMHLVAVTHVKLVKCGSWVWFVIEPRLPVICKIELKLLKYGNLFSTDALPNGFDWICLELSQSKTNVTKLSQKILSTNKTTAWHWLRLSHCLVTTSFAMKTYMFIIGYVTNTNGGNLTSLHQFVYHNSQHFILEQDNEDERVVSVNLLYIFKIEECLFIRLFLEYICTK